MHKEILLPEKYRNLQRLGNHDYRIRSKFLWWPKTIGDQTSWLCTRMWIEESVKIYTTNWFNLIGGSLVKWTDWKAIQWL